MCVWEYLLIYIRAHCSSSFLRISSSKPANFRRQKGFGEKPQYTYVLMTLSDIRSTAISNMCKILISSLQSEQCNVIVPLVRRHRIIVRISTYLLQKYQTIWSFYSHIVNVYLHFLQPYKLSWHQSHFRYQIITYQRLQKYSTYDMLGRSKQFNKNNYKNYICWYKSVSRKMFILYLHIISVEIRKGFLYKNLGRYITFFLKIIGLSSRRKHEHIVFIPSL